jgi:hypothetical protein
MFRANSGHCCLLQHDTHTVTVSLRRHNSIHHVFPVFVQISCMSDLQDPKSPSIEHTDQMQRMALLFALLLPLNCRSVTHSKLFSTQTRRSKHVGATFSPHKHSTPVCVFRTIFRINNDCCPCTASTGSSV